MAQHGGRRTGAGRPKGSIGLKPGKKGLRQPGGGRPKGTTKVKLTQLPRGDMIAAALASVIVSPSTTPGQLLKAVDVLSRHNKVALRAAQEERERALQAGGKPPPGPLRFETDQGTVELADVDGALGWLARHTCPINEVEPYHPPEWVAMTHFLVRRRLKLSPGDRKFIDDLLNRSDPIATRVAGSAVPTQPPSPTETERLASLFWATDGTEAYLAAPGEA